MLESNLLVPMLYLVLAGVYLVVFPLATYLYLQQRWNVAS